MYQVSLLWFSTLQEVPDMGKQVMEGNKHTLYNAATNRLIHKNAYTCG